MASATPWKAVTAATGISTSSSPIRSTASAPIPLRATRRTDRVDLLWAQFALSDASEANKSSSSSISSWLAGQCALILAGGNHVACTTLVCGGAQRRNALHFAGCARSRGDAYGTHGADRSTNTWHRSESLCPRHSRRATREQSNGQQGLGNGRRCIINQSLRD